MTLDLTPCPFIMGTSTAREGETFPIKMSGRGEISCNINNITYKDKSSPIKDHNYATIVYNKITKQSEVFYNKPRFISPVFETEIIDHDSEQQAVGRAELTNEFGSVWSKKSLRERDLVEARTLAANDANVLQKVAVGVAKVKNEVKENFDEKEVNGVAKTQQEQLLPQFDQRTKIVSKIFPLSSLIPPSIATALAEEANTISTADDKTRRELIKRNHYPSFIAERFQFLPMDNLEAVGMSKPATKRRRKDASSDAGERMTRIQMATILAYLGHMFKLLQLRMNELQQKIPLPSTPAMVAKELLNNFTTLTVHSGKSRSRTRLITPMLRDRLIYHILVLILHCDNFSTVIDKLPVDFKMSSATLKKYFTFIGCTFAVQEVKSTEGEEEEEAAEKKTQTIAHLRAPLVFKAPRSFRR